MDAHPYIRFEGDRRQIVIYLQRSPSRLKDEIWEPTHPTLKNPQN